MQTTEASFSFCSSITRIKTFKVRPPDTAMVIGYFRHILGLVAEGDRVAQLIIEKIETPEVVEVNVCFPSSVLLFQLKFIFIRT